MTADDRTTNDPDDLDAVLVPTEEAHPDRREHAKTPKHSDDDELVRRTQHERDVVAEDREQQR
ncbi:MAG: hypothetical protein AB1925_07395 [Actinomycetota bacterium]